MKFEFKDPNMTLPEFLLDCFGHFVVYVINITIVWGIYSLFSSYSETLPQLSYYDVCLVYLMFKLLAYDFIINLELKSNKDEDVSTRA